METKTCNTCGIEKELSSFYTAIQKKRNDRPYTFATCRSCVRVRGNQWRKDNPERHAEAQKRNRARNGKTFYKNQVEKRKTNWIHYSQQRKEWDANRNRPKIELIALLLEVQGNKCVICLRSFEGTTYDVDHSHESGLVRGLLCRKCNSGLHYLEDKIFIEKATQYLSSPPASAFKSVKY